MTGQDEYTPFEIFIRGLNARNYEFVEVETTGLRSGIHILLPNRWVVWIFYGFGSYSTEARKRLDDREFEPIKNPQSTSAVMNNILDVPNDGWITIAIDAEIAAWHKPDEIWHKFEDGDTVKGYQTREQVWAFMKQVEQFPDAPPENGE